MSYFPIVNDEELANLKYNTRFYILRGDKFNIYFSETKKSLP